MQKLNIAIYIIFIVLSALALNFMDDILFIYIIVCCSIPIIILYQILLLKYIKFKKVSLTKDVYKYALIQSLKIALLDIITLSTIFLTGSGSAGNDLIENVFQYQ